MTDRYNVPIIRSIQTQTQRANTMNFKAELVKRLKGNINGMLKAGVELDTAIARAKEDSVAGPAVWVEVLKTFNK